MRGVFGIVQPIPYRGKSSPHLRYFIELSPTCKYTEA